MRQPPDSESDSDSHVKASGWRTEPHPRTRRVRSPRAVVLAASAAYEDRMRNVAWIVTLGASALALGSCAGGRAREAPPVRLREPSVAAIGSSSAYFAGAQTFFGTSMLGGSADMGFGRQIPSGSGRRPDESIWLPSYTSELALQEEGGAARRGGGSPWVDVARAPRSTFALDVDTGSYTLTCETLRAGRLPSGGAVRPEELVNALPHPHDPLPGPSEVFGIGLELAPDPLQRAPNRAVLRVGLRTAPVPRAVRRPVSLVLLVDVSASMEWRGKLEAVKAALGELVRALRPDDEVALVTFNVGARVVLAPARVDTEMARILDAIASLQALGGTGVQAGLELAYARATEWFRWPEAEQAARPERTVRVMLFSDGCANVGFMKARPILERVRAHRLQGITLSTVGVGLAAAGDALLEELADRGDGNYAHLDGAAEARRVLVEAATGTLEVVAKDAKASVELDPRAVASYRLVGYENRRLPEHAFRDDRIDGGEVGPGHSVSAIYELVLRQAPPETPLATVRLRYQAPEGGRPAEQARTIRVGELQPASATLRRDVAAARFADALAYRDEPRALARIAALLEEVVAEAPADPWSRELAELVARAEELTRSAE